MAHDWIIDVLTDLKTFARSNGFASLAEHLDDTQMVAQIEIASHAKGMACGIGTNDAVAGRHTAAVGMR
ncbi:hypothetical protein [Puniceibacterium sediminis]|uniref:Uncharacterized protein n=1 Tax=Puniceibacterium sediminis TaxID=1608407 RepID=A0A238WJ14_9RHOB|nr:hypothetical protein [Puniceibacterium sediminis]SNR46576.1 hypothetical protein SAMN06265370_10657 [Puniceibacterium sediminis]